MSRLSALSLSLFIAAFIPTTQASAANTLSADQFEVVFGPLTQGSSKSQPQTVNITNVGATAISNIAVAISGTNAADFSSTNNCGTSLPSTQSCAIQVTFTPAATGVLTATLSITSTGTPSPLTVALQGIGASTSAGIFFVNPSSEQATATLGSTVAMTPAFFYNPPPVTYAQLTLYSVQIQGTDAADYQVSSTGTPPFTCYQLCAIPVNFTPGALGARSATLAINTNAGTVTIPLNGVGVSPSTTLSLSSSSLPFGSEALHTASVPQAVTVSATGTNPVTINSATISGVDPTDFSVTNTCTASPITPSSAFPPAGCPISVTFAPHATGSRTATLTIADDAVGSPHSVMLSGTGVSATASLLVGNEETTVYSNCCAQGIVPATDFGVVTIGFSNTITNQILNTGGAAATVAESISGPNATDFVLNPSSSSTDCKAAPSLAPNASCTSTIGFTPSLATLETATLTVKDSISGIAQTFPLTGTGVTGTKIILFQTTANSSNGGGLNSQRSFGAVPVGYNMNASITIENVGTDPVTFTGAYVSGGNASDFGLEGYNCSNAGNSPPNVVGPGQTCTAFIGFAPSGEGYRAATLNILDDAQNGMQTIGLSGAGLPPAAYQPASPEALDFSYTAVGRTSYGTPILFTNIGNGAVTVSQLTISGQNAADFTVYQNTCGQTVLYTCTVSVQYTPSVTGPEVAYLSLVNNSQYGNVVVPLYGIGESGTNTGVVATPSALRFGVPSTSSLGVIESSATVQLSNPSGEPLQILSTSITGPDAADFVVNYSFTGNEFGSLALCDPNTGYNSCTLQLYFFSGSSGPEVATLTIVTNAGTATVSLLGNETVLAAAVRAAPVNISAAVGSVTEYSEGIYQIGTEALQYSFANPPIVGPNATDFAIGALSCDYLQINCTVPIVFVPGATGPRTASLLLLTPTAAPILIPLNGTGQ